jgi:hypothetical protein
MAAATAVVTQPTLVSLARAVVAAAAALVPSSVVAVVVWVW